MLLLTYVIVMNAVSCFMFKSTLSRCEYLQNLKSYYRMNDNLMIPVFFVANG